MAADTKIQWCDHTMNFWVGCTKVSAACDFCYAETWAKRSGHPELWAGERRRTSASLWAQPLKWNKAAREGGERRRVFSNSLSDFFDNQVPEQWRSDAWDVITRCESLDWLLLTKRPQNIAKMIQPRWEGILPGNVWLGMTAENNDELHRRYRHLSSIPARVHFISYEPALELVDFRELYPRPDWVIIGGESGGHARPFHTEWAQSTIDQCREIGAAPFVKQLGAHVIQDGERKKKRDSHGGDMSEWPHELRVREFPVTP